MVIAGTLSVPAFAINLQPGFDTGPLAASQVTPSCQNWSKNLSCADNNQQAVDDVVYQLSSGGSSGVSSFNTRTGAVTLSSSDVTTAVGSTTYDAYGASANGTTAYGWGNWASNFGTTSGTIAQGNDSRINNGQTAYGWGNPSGVYLPIAGTAADSAKLNGQAASYYYPASNPNSYTTLAAVAAVGYVTGTPWSGL